MSYKGVLIYFFLCLQITVVFANKETDSLINIWKDTKLPLRERAEAARKIANSLRYSRPDSAYRFYRLYFNYAKDIGEKDLIVLSNLGLGNYYNITSHSDSALTYYHRGLELCDRTDRFYKKRYALLSGLGNLEGRLGNYDDAILLMDSAEHYYKLAYPQKEEITITFQRAVYHDLAEQTDSAMTLYERIVNTAIDSIPNNKEALEIKAYTYQRLGNSLSDLTRAKNCLDSSVSFFSMMGNRAYLSSSYTGLSRYYLFKVEDIDSALLYAKKACQLTFKSSFNEYKMESVVLLAQVYYQKELYDSAIVTCRGLIKETSNDTNKYLEAAYDVMFRAYGNLNQTDSAYLYLQRYNLAQQLVQRKTNKEKIKNALTLAKFNEKKQALKNSELDNNLLTSQLVLEKRNKLLTLAIFVIVGFLGVYLYLRYRNRQLSDKLAMESNIKNLQLNLNETLLALQHKREVIDAAKRELITLKKNKEINTTKWFKVNAKLNQQTDLDKDLHLFEDKLFTSSLHFNNKLKSYNSNLSKKEMRLAALIKLGLTSKDIAALFSIELESVYTSRVRLRKKLDLEAGQDLASFLQSL